jgi:hypothetical protein
LIVRLHHLPKISTVAADLIARQAYMASIQSQKVATTAMSHVVKRTPRPAPEFR